MARVPRDIRCIVVPTDFSPTATAALDYATALARRLGATLIVVHAIEPADAPMPQTLADAEMVGAVQSLERAVDALRREGLVADSVVRHGPAARVTIGLAHERSADLIVLGTHGRTGLSRLLLGSVAENVLRHADCPVLTVKPESAADGGA